MSALFIPIRSVDGGLAVNGPATRRVTLTPDGADAMSHAAGGDPLDDLLSSYERRKQDEARRWVERAERIERDRLRGAEVLRRYAVDAIREACARVEGAGHRVLLQELLQDYPPNIRVHLWPRPGPLEDPESRRCTFELLWGEPHADMLCARRWSSAGLGAILDQGAESEGDLDALWVREQFLDFLREALGMS